MKSFLALLLVTAGVTAELNLQNVEVDGAVRRRGGHECDEHTTCETCAGDDDCHYNLRLGRCVDKSGRNSGERWAKKADDCPDTPPRFALGSGATCGEGYEPLTTRWEHCAKAARFMGFKGDDVAYVQYNKPWGTTRPQGCFRKGNGQFHFNDGAGGNFRGNDRILCVLEGEGPVDDRRQVESSVESDGKPGPIIEESAPEGNAPAVLGGVSRLNPPRTGNFSKVEFALAPPSANVTAAKHEYDYRFYTEEEGWTDEEPLERLICGADERVRVHNTKDEPWRWVVDLEITLANGKRTGCTGFFISKRAIITNAHCVHSASDGGWLKHIKVCPGRNGGHDPFGCQWGNRVWVPQGWIDTRSLHFDYATASLPDNRFWDRGVGYFGFTTGTDYGGVNIAGYPGDKGGNTLQWSFGAFEVWSQNEQMWAYHMDIYFGNSGGPVWVYLPDIDQRYVIGVHGYGGCPNLAVRVNDPVYDWMWDFRNQFN